MTEATTLRCSRCDQHLPADAFAPSSRRDGDWCRACRKAYMKSYNANRKADEQFICIDCGTSFQRWADYHSGGIKGRCRDCFNSFRRERENLKGRPRRPASGLPPAGTRPRWHSSIATRAVRDQVYAEESRCGICGETVDVTLKFPDPLSPSIDHIVPVALNGSNERENLRLTHFKCNASGGDARLAMTERVVILRFALEMAGKI